MNPDAARLALVLVFAILAGIVIAVVRKHRQRRIFLVPPDVKRDQLTHERRAKIARLQRRVSADAHRRVH